MTKGAAHALAIVCALAVALLAWGATRPLSAWRRDLDARCAALQANMDSAPRVRRRHAALEEQLSSLVDRVGSVVGRVPERAGDDIFLSDATKIADEHEVRIADFQRGTDTEHPTHSVVRVNLSVEGSFAGLCALVEEVQRLPRVAALAALRIDARGRDGRYSAQLGYDLYYGMRRRNADAIAAAPTPTGGAP